MHTSHPEKDAAAAGLRYAVEGDMTIRRVARGGSFAYERASGAPVRAGADLARIVTLAIPPAWTGVRIAGDAKGHLQAVGVDARGRTQRRYHAAWSVHRNGKKFAAMPGFGRALPALRRRVAADLRLPGLPREKVIALAVRLLDTALVRVGNEEYARSNRSYGLTTLRDRHAEVRGGEIRLSFRAKSGKDCEVVVEDPRAARVLKGCQDLPGQHLFNCRDTDGKVHPIGSSDVNAYLGRVMGSPYTAKDFRTWGGTVVAAEALHRCGAAAAIGREGAALTVEVNRRCVAAIRAAAGALSNTPATCRKFYVHPAIVEAYGDGRLEAAFAGSGRGRRGLRVAERAVLDVLRGPARRRAAGHGTAAAA